MWWDGQMIAMGRNPIVAKKSGGRPFGYESLLQAQSNSSIFRVFACLQQHRRGPHSVTPLHHIPTATLMNAPIPLTSLELLKTLRSL